MTDRPNPARARGVALLALALALVLVTAACGGDDDDSGSSGSNSGEVDTTPASANDLSSQNWQLKSFVVGSGGALSTGSEAAPATAVFKSGTTTGSTGCNNYTVTYDLGSNGAIKFGAVAATKALCPGNLNEQEQGLINGYSAARKAVINDGALQLLGPGGNPLLIFTPVKGQELEGIDWRLINFRTPTAVTSSIAGADVTATFADGKLTGRRGLQRLHRRVHRRQRHQRSIGDHRRPTRHQDLHHTGRRRATGTGLRRRARNSREVRDRRQQAHAPERARPRRRDLPSRRLSSTSTRFGQRSRACNVCGALRPCSAARRTVRDGAADGRVSFLDGEQLDGSQRRARARRDGKRSCRGRFVVG